MADRFFAPYFTPVDGNGVVYPGGKLFFYVTGTSTPLDTYNDDALTTPNTNPVLADGAGRFPTIFLLPRPYKVVLQDASGVQVWSADPYTPPGGGPGIAVTYDTRAQAAAAYISTTKNSVQTSGYTTLGDGGAALYKRVGAQPSHNGKFQSADGAWWELAEIEPSVGMFGAVSYAAVDQTTAADAVGAFNDCLAYCKLKGLRRMRAPGNYGFGSTWEINDISADSGGMTITIGQIKALSSWTTPPSGIINKQPLIGIGRNNASSNFLNLNMHINSLVGYALGQDGVRFAGGGPSSSTNGYGAALCDIFIGHAESLNCVVHISGQKVGNPSNLFRGNRWAGNMVGALFNGGTPGGTFPIVEGQRVYVDFISSNRYGGVFLLKDSRYHDIISQLDFNGQYCSELLVTSLTGADQFETITGGTSGATGEILATYTWRGDRFILVGHSTNVINDTSPFSAGETVSWSGGSATLTSIRTCSNVAATSWYFDIVLATQGSGSFHRGLIRSGYMGGIVGDFLYTDQINGANNRYNWNWQNGSGFDHSSTQWICRDIGISDTDVLMEATDELFRPHRDIFLSGQRIYGSETNVSLPQNVSTQVADLSGVATAANGKAWLIFVHGVGSPDALSCAIVAMSSTGVFDITNLGTTYVSLSVTAGGSVLALQNAQPSMLVHRTFLQIA